MIPRNRFVKEGVTQNYSYYYLLLLRCTTFVDQNVFSETCRLYNLCFHKNLKNTSIKHCLLRVWIVAKLQCNITQEMNNMNKEGYSHELSNRI